MEYELPTMTAYELYSMLKDEFEERGVEKSAKLFFVDKENKRHEIKRLGRKKIMENCVMDFNSDAYPIMGIKKGETLQIIVCNPKIQNKKFLNEKNKEIYKIPNGRYLAVKDSKGNFVCKEQPLLSGAYTFHSGNKYHWTGIYADKLESKNWGSYEKWKKMKDAESKKINCTICGKRFIPYADTDKCPDCYVIYETMINKDNENMTVYELRKKINAVIGQ